VTVNRSRELFDPSPLNAEGPITVFADASFCDKTKAAGWGAWYRGDGMTSGMYVSGIVPALCTGSHDAEFWGIAMALAKVKEALKGQKPRVIILQCDNVHALAWVKSFLPNAKPVGAHHETHEITNPPRKTPLAMRPAIDLLRGVDPDCKIWLKHVKAHENGVTGRSHINERCDRNAYYQMDIRRAQIETAAERQKMAEVRRPSLLRPMPPLPRR
jgi:ribonuclease HI